MKKIGIYGGSFNPPHKGHVNLVNTVCNKFNLDEIWIVPSYYHRFKKSEINNRFKIHDMVCLAFPNIIGKTKIFYEADREEWKGSTYKMMKDFVKENKNTKFFVIMGTDCVRDLEKYLNYKKLIKEFEFIIVGREFQSPFLTIDKVGIELFFDNKVKFQYTETKDESSSSKFKEAIKSIPVGVLEYIYENKMYLDKEETKDVVGKQSAFGQLSFEEEKKYRKIRKKVNKNGGK